jgi:hypothetical protein
VRNLILRFNGGEGGSSRSAFVQFRSKIRPILITLAHFACVVGNDWPTDVVIDTYLSFLFNQTPLLITFANTLFVKKLDIGVSGVDENPLLQ